ncbi:MAG: zinc ribbon domain-containing protein [Acidobacteria bacterium]|nr:zinc ribbon domain-containing protein [Acidobacteriota bacterium]
MTEEAAENEFCAECGADIRPEALFCYNCGEAVADAEANADQAEKEVSDAWFREDIAEEDLSEKEDEIGHIENEEIDKPGEELLVSDESQPAVSAKTKKKPKVRRKPKMRSAATIQKTRAKSLPKKKVEVVWEENDNSPNFWFILTSVVIVVIVAGLFYLARILQ